MIGLVVFAGAAIYLTDTLKQPKPVRDNPIPHLPIGERDLATAGPWAIEPGCQISPRDDLPGGLVRVSTHFTGQFHHNARLDTCPVAGLAA
jgi:hypothetical protein